MPCFLCKKTISLPHAQKREKLSSQDSKSTLHLYGPFLLLFRAPFLWFWILQYIDAHLDFLKRRLVLFYYFYTENSGWKLWMTLLTKDWICWPLFVRSGHSFYYSTLFLTLRKWFDVAMATPIASMGGELNRSMFDLSFCLNDDLIPYCTQYYYHDTFKIIWSAFISLGNVRLRP